MKHARGETTKNITSVLETSVGTFHGDDVLEVFAADAEHLAKPNDGNTWFDHNFYKLCKLDSLYIFYFLNTNQLKIPPMKLSIWITSCTPK